MKITISGNPGSGKSTVAKLLAKKLNYNHYEIGDLFRKLALKKGITLNQLLKKSENSPKLDKEMDQVQIDIGKSQDNFVMVSRLGYYFIPDSVKVFLDVDQDKAIERLLKDSSKLRSAEKLTVSQIKSKLEQRKHSEIKRYKKFYNTNPYDKRHYNLVIDTSKLKPSQVVSKILQTKNFK